MTHRLGSRRRAPHRGAFTLIELLVVITIISILTALVTVASMRFITSAREAATRTTIKKVSEAINDRVGAVNRFHQRPPSRLEHDWNYGGWSQRWDIAGVSQLGQTQSQSQRDAPAKLVLSRKYMLRDLLPITQAELKNAYWFWAKFQDSDPTTPDRIPLAGILVPGLNPTEQAKMTAWLADMDGDSSNGMQGLDRPGEVLYYALLNAPVFGGQRMLEEDFKPSELVDPDQDGIFEIGDAWGNELRFYRWPTRLVNNSPTPLPITWPSPNQARSILMPDAPSQLDLQVDPDDRAGYLANPAPLYIVETDSLTTMPGVTLFHDPDTWHAPLLVSAGPDGILGLMEPGDPEPMAIPGFPPRTGLAVPLSTAADQEGLYDNLTNHNASGGF